MIEFANPIIQKEYDMLKFREGELLDELWDVQDRIRQLVEKEEHK